jgi:DNA polymerase-1
LEHLDELQPRVRQNLGEMRERVQLNREMSVLRRDVDVGVDITELRPETFDREQARVLFDQLEFRTLWTRLLEAVGETAVEVESETLATEVEVLPDAAAAVRRLRACGPAPPTAG